MQAHVNRRRLLQAIGAAALPGVSLANEPFPSRPITLIVPFPAGGVGDYLARVLGKHLSTKWSQTVIVENKPGASTILGSEYVARAKPDGYTLLVMSSSLTTIPATNPSALRFDPAKSFTPISKLVQMPLVIAVRKDSSFHSVQEMIAYAKANPGALMVGVSPGSGGNAHLAFERLKLESKIDAVAVPYKGSAPAVQALLAGEVMATVDAVPGIIPLIQAGKAQAIAVMTPQRISASPQIPTVSETGLPNYEADTWTGFAGPKGMPPELVRTIQQAVQEIIQMPEVKSQLVSMGMEPVGSSAKDFDATIEKNILEWKQIAHDSKFKFEG